MTTFLYGRVSTIDQDSSLQERELKAKYPNGIYREEKKSGTSLEGRDTLRLILDMITNNDRLIVWKLDRLARNMKDLSDIVSLIESKGAYLEILDQAIDTKTATGKAFLQMLGVFAEFETNLRRERQMAGIINAKEKGKHMGRKAILNETQVESIRLSQSNPTQLSREYGVSRATIYNVLKG